jgi:uncharacterized protein
MNPQERTLLENFLAQLVQVRGVDKEPQADSMIKRAVDQQPDAAYLLVQRALLLGRALEQAKTRIAELERAQESSSRSFLESGASGWSAAAPQASTATAASGRAPVGTVGSSFQSTGPQSSGPFNTAPAGAPMPAQAGAPSFLGQAAATAAGVAGGAFLFEGIESLLGHHGSAIPGQEAAAPFDTPEDVTINNYYASDDRSGETGDARLEGDDADADPDADSDPDLDADSDPDVEDDSGDFV